MRIDIVMEALESIDVAPRRSPAAEIALEFLNGRSERCRRSCALAFVAE